MQDFERLGVFYLGRQYDLAARRATDELVLYDAKDLTTHAVCVGMTGSGKTGLCIALLEEAGIPTAAAEGSDLVKDADGDARADLAVGSGEGSPAKVRVYLGKDFTTAAEPGTFEDIPVFGGTALSGGVFVG